MIKLLVPNDKSLSLSAMGVLSTMLNLPECDYKSVNDLLQFAAHDETEIETQRALDELVEHGYVERIDDKFAVNKYRIPEMKFVYAAEPMNA